jgi:uncharacterized protein (TIGR02594 family)
MKPIEYALVELVAGVAEVPGPGSNPRVLEYLHTVGLGRDDETAWCSAFTNWCHEQAGITGTGKGNARSWLSWGGKPDSPCLGDVVVLWRGSRDGWQGHVGFWVGGSGGAVLILGGNQGDRVSIAAYSPERVLGYRRAT